MSGKKSSKQKLEESFLKLLDKKPLSEITISEITDKAKLNRNTFYYYYSSIADLIESTIKSSVDQLFENYPPRIDSPNDCFLVAVDYAKKNEAAIRNIYHSVNRAIFERHLWHICDYSVSLYVDSIFNNSKIPFNLEIQDGLRDLLKFGIFGFIIDWINRGMPNDVSGKIQSLSLFFRQLPKLDY